MKGFRIFLITMLIIGIILEMGALIYADTTRIDGSITLKGGLVLLVCVPISGLLMAKSLLILYFTKDETE